jgi:hypothetical protein
MGIEEFLLDQAEKKGKEQGMTQKEIAFPGNLLSSTDFSIAMIAQLVGVSEDLVLTIKKELNK